MSRLTRDGTAEPVPRDQILRHERGLGNTHFPCSADHEQDWQPLPVDPYSALCDDHTYTATMHTHVIYCRLSIDRSSVFLCSMRDDRLIDSTRPGEYRIGCTHNT